MTSFRLLHASDLHVSVNADLINVYDIEGFWGLVGQSVSQGFRRSIILSSFNSDTAAAFSYEVKVNAGRVDAVLITGDIATTGESCDLAAARNYFEGYVSEEWGTILPESLSPMIGPGLPPLVMMPGNHDRYSGKTYSPSSREFENVFGPLWDFSATAADSWHGSHKFVRTTFLSKSKSLLALCRVDFSLTDLCQVQDNILGHLGQGKVRRKSDANGPLDALDELIAQTEKATALKADGYEVSIVWCVHFPPQYPGIPNALKLIDEDDLLAAAKKFDIRLILSGHTHKFETYVVNQGRTKVVCCGTTTGMSQDDGNDFLEITINTDDMINPEILRKRWNGSVDAKSFE